MNDLNHIINRSFNNCKNSTFPIRRRKETEVANTSHDAWRWKNVKKKTDKEDALKLAKLSAMNQIPTVHMPAKKVREHRSLIKYRQRLVKNIPLPIVKTENCAF